MATYKLYQTLNDSTSSLSGDTVEAKEQTVTITANDGFKIDSAKYRCGPFGSFVQFDIASDGLTATATMTPTNNLFISVVTSAIVLPPKTFTVTGNFSNAYYDVTPKEVTEGVKTTLTAKQTFGDYEFTSLSYVMGSGEPVDVELTGDKGSATITLTPTGNIVFTGASQKRAPKSFKVTQTLGDSTSSINSNTIGVDEMTVTITAKDGFTISTASYKFGASGTATSMTISDDKLTATATFAPTDDLYITVTTAAIPVSYNWKVVKNLTHATTDAPDTLDSGKTTITVNAESGFSFQVVPTVKVHDTFINNHDFTLNEDRTKGTATISLDEATHATATVTIEATGTVNATHLSAFSNLYKMTNVTLNALAKERFYTDNSGAVHDYGIYVYNLVLYPFDLPTNIVGDDNRIQMGGLEAKTVAPFITNNQCTINLGTIKVPNVHNDFSDYSGDATLKAPFIDDVVLDINRIMGKDVSVVYEVNLFNRGTTVNVMVDGETITSTQANIGDELPFIQKQNESVVGTITSQLMNAIFTAYIVIQRPTPVIDPMGYETLEKGKLSDYTGYVECSNIMLNTMATVSEQEEIQNLLQQGVVINA